jgi:hypothetical protein
MYYIINLYFYLILSESYSNRQSFSVGRNSALQRFLNDKKPLIEVIPQLGLCCPILCSEVSSNPICSANLRLHTPHKVALPFLGGLSDSLNLLNAAGLS